MNIRGIKQNTVTYAYHTKDQQKLWVVAERGANALNFDHISQLNWEDGKKGEIVKKGHNRPQMESANQYFIPNLFAEV